MHICLFEKWENKYVELSLAAIMLRAHVLPDHSLLPLPSWVSGAHLQGWNPPFQPKHLSTSQLSSDSEKLQYFATSWKNLTSSIAASWSRDRTSKRTIWRGEDSQFLDICMKNNQVRTLHEYVLVKEIYNKELSQIIISAVEINQAML